jgi:hypothetical protein
MNQPMTDNRKAMAPNQAAILNPPYLSIRARYPMEHTHEIYPIELNLHGNSPLYSEASISFLRNIPASLAAHRTSWNRHSIWEMVSRQITELEQAAGRMKGLPAGSCHEEPILRLAQEPSQDAWLNTIERLSQASRNFARAMCQGCSSESICE